MDKILINSTVENEMTVFLEKIINSNWVWVILVWIFIWKGLALWQASQRKQKIWFLLILVINDLGILEIIYLAYYYFKDRKTKITENKA